MSEETISSSVYPNTPARSPSAASRNAALMSFSVGSPSKSTTSSVSEPVGTGTRMAIPSSFPSSWGRTCVVACAAPVEVGTMFSAAARLRRRLLWGPSMRF